MNKFTAVLATLIVVMMFVISNQRNEVYNATKELSEWKDSVQYYYNREGELVAQKNVAELELDDLKKLNDQLGIDMKELKDQVGNLKNLNSYYRGQVSTRGRGTSITIDTVVQVIENTDTVEVAAQSVDWTNDYLAIDGIFIPRFNRWDFNYSYKVDFDITSYHKKTRKGLFAPKTLVVDLKLSDPNARVVDLQALQIKRENKWYQSTAFKVGIGLVGGFFIANEWK